ncbi:DHA2 family efflux MFS transporter permease subunit [Actinomadura mexicana]|uniref:Drug resistance transporter, EmrB/QacA subfamily n=1 Tax=Actinomadura mexicana TaxID=134959 RepID=A0A238XN95_9ACTN|nr:DHA2 family efflux MFS transporter permease subunit [Actinomadura mexicana]SNR59459.1 drug resistance transporter, EmrB/QacA subfamily [Actinomadura mexicana]
MPEPRPAPASQAVLRPHLPLGAVVAMSCVAFFMVVLDSTIVTLALPQMRDGLDLSVSEQQWVVSGYLVTLGGLLLLAARAGDLFGHKRVFLLGTVVFTVASLVGGLATNAAMLIVARIVQGAGAAALTPASLSLITASHTDEDQRRRALAVWSIMSAVAGTAGVVLGGVLTTGLSWRWVLFVNVPPGIGLFAAAAWFLLPAAAGGKRIRLDVPGALSVTLGTGLLTYGLSQASTDGWGAPKVVISLVAAAVLIIGFVVIQFTGSQPLIPRSLFRLRGLRIGNLVMLLMGVTMNASFFFISLYLQQAIGYSALRAGMAMVPVTIIIVIAGLASRRLVPVLGPRLMLIIGGLITAAGMAWLAGVPTRPPVYAAHVLGPTLLAGLGMGFMLLSITLSGTSGVDPEDAGAASGLLNTSRQVGGAIGLAVLTTIAANATSGAADGSSPVEALVHGYHVAFLVNAGVMVAAVLTALALPRMAAPAPQAGEAAGDRTAKAQS